MKKITLLLLNLLLLGSWQVIAQNWVNGGNNLGANGTLGTNTNFSVIFETNGSERGRVTNTGLWGFGTNNPNVKVHINSVTGQDPLKVQVNGSLKFFVHRGGGVNIGSSATPAPPANGLKVFGSTGIGSDPGSYKLKVTHATFGLDIENATTLDDWEFWSNSGGLSLYANGNFRGSFDITTGAYTSISDEGLKTDIKAMPSVLEKVNQLKPTTYQFKTEGQEKNSSTPTYGFLAQEVMEVFPHLVTHLVDQERELDTYTMDYSGFGVIAIKAIQELQQTISTLENRIKQLEALQAVSNNPLNGTGMNGVWLEKNLPNPFDQLTTIGYQVTEQAQQVSLLITNLQGVEVQRFDHLTVGQGQVEIAAGSIPKGTYVYTLVVDGKPVASDKMILNR